MNHFRLYDVFVEAGVVVRLELFTVIKETPQGYWVLSENGPRWLTPEQCIKQKCAKWVSKTSRRRHCYPDMAQALASYKRRKEVQVSRLRVQLEQAEKVVAEMHRLDGLTAGDIHHKGITLGPIGANEWFQFE